MKLCSAGFKPAVFWSGILSGYFPSAPLKGAVFGRECIKSYAAALAFMARIICSKES